MGDHGVYWLKVWASENQKDLDLNVGAATYLIKFTSLSFGFLSLNRDKITYFKEGCWEDEEVK